MVDVSDLSRARKCPCSDKRSNKEEEEENEYEDEDEGKRLVECLRGRLLAERQASRAAKEEAELMEKMLVDLEMKLREETKLRDKAQKKLRFLEKKLECFGAFWGDCIHPVLVNLSSF